MGSSSLFIISTLALFGAAASQTCSTELLGPQSVYPINFKEIEVPPGTSTLFFPNPCPSSSVPVEVGIEVTTCSVVQPAPSVNLFDLEHATISTLYGAKITATAYCNYGPQKYAASVRGVHRPGNYYVDVAPADPFLAGNVAGNFFVGQGQ